MVTGVFQPTLIEVLSYQGACEKSTFLFILPTYIGMAFSVLSNIRSLTYGKIRWARMSTLVLIDLFSGILCFTGLVNAGSAIFTVVYSSVTVYTALFSWLFFGRQLHYMQWSGVCLVMVGLISSSFGGNMFSDDSEDVGIGVMMIMVGSMFHSLYYIISESILKDDDPIAPEFLATFQGLCGSFVFGLWQFIYTFPRWDSLISDEIAAHNGDFFTIAFTYVMLVIVNFIHGVCFFHMLKMVGSTTTGVLKGVISVLVFIISHFAFCSFQKSQCFSVGKGMSLVLVVLGVACYSVFKPEKVTIPPELAPTRNDLLSKASTIWIHEQGHTELTPVNRAGPPRVGGHRMKKPGGRTSFDAYDAIPSTIHEESSQKN